MDFSKKHLELDAYSIYWIKSIRSFQDGCDLNVRRCKWFYMRIVEGSQPVMYCSHKPRLGCYKGLASDCIREFFTLKIILLYGKFGQVFKSNGKYYNIYFYIINRYFSRKLNFRFIINYILNIVKKYGIQPNVLIDGIQCKLYL